MRPALVLSTLVLGGCCCGLGGGGGSSGGLGERMGDAMSKKIEEAVVEKAYEAGTGHDLDIDAAGAKIVAETDEGKVTTYLDGAVPEGFDWPLPSDAKVTMGTRLDHKDTAKGVTWVVTYETTQDWKTVAAALQAEGEKRGYKVTSTTAAMKQALEEAKAQGVTIDPAMMGGTGTETGDMLAFEHPSDPNKSGGATVDGSTPGKTSVMLTVQ